MIVSNFDGKGDDVIAAIILCSNLDYLPFGSASLSIQSESAIDGFPK